MDLRNVFKEISEQLLAEFRKSAEVQHSGGKGELREYAFSKFLQEYLPTRYAIGRGEVISPENLTSPQMDIVIYDPAHCPALIKSSSHAVYPIESVFGAISMKSHLDSAELREAYANISAFKKITRKEPFQLNPAGGLLVGMAAPMPVTGVVAYGAKRTLEAIAQQALELDEELPDSALRPDFIVVVGVGIIGPRITLRGSHNKFELPEEKGRLVELRRTGRHTLLRIYMQILQELNAITLRPLDLNAYYDMPKIIGKYRVKKHHTFVKTPIGGDEGRVIRLNEFGIAVIVKEAKAVTLRQHYMNHIGTLPPGEEKTMDDQIVHEYNPNNLPPITMADIRRNEKGRPYSVKPIFLPAFLEIDGRQYAVDLSALSEAHFDPEMDFTVDELLAT